MFDEFDDVIELILVYWERSKNERPRFYLYTDDGEKLLIVAELVKNKWNISGDAIKCSPSDSLFMGNLKSTDTKQYSGYFHNDEVIRVRLFDSSQQRTDKLEFTVSIHDSKITTLMQEISQDDQIQFLCGNNRSFQMNNIQESEYKMLISKPLSIFHGFCIGISIILLSS